MQRKTVSVSADDDDEDGPKQPTEKMYEDVKALADHVAVRELFLTYISSSELIWPPNDVVADRTVADVVTVTDPPPLPDPLEQPQTSAQAAVQGSTSPPRLEQRPPEQDAPVARKPTKRPRREPAPTVLAGPSTQIGRVTRSRSAANAAAANATAAAPTPPSAPSVDIPRRATRSQTRASIKQAATPDTKTTPGDSGVASRLRGTGRVTRASTRPNARSRQQSNGKDPAKNASSAGKTRTRRK
ncbi:hypothetical protein C8Q76DRAFT_781077 [Earliella scabrosa]|nr:hypothetical protein C8Q76DRAFT_781077 [Earliella scabrosa]